MRISELTGYKNKGYYPVAQHVFSSGENPFERFDKFLIDKGFVKLGGGKFGVVYEKVGYPWVFKIYREEKPYEFFYKYMKANQGNPHIPKIRGGRIRIVDGIYALRIEKLMPISDELYNQLYHIIKVMFMYDMYPEGSEMKNDALGLIERFKKKSPNLYKVIDDMMNTNYKLDFHRGNIMMRGNVPVIIDPVTLG